MYQNSLIILAAFAFSQVAYAQSSSSTINTSTSSDQTTSVMHAPKLKIAYNGILRGPGLNSSNFAQSDNSATSLENRFKFNVETSDKLSFGLEARIATAKSQDEFTVNNNDYRLSASIKHLYQKGILDFSLIPRIKLPTSKKSFATNKVLFGTELIANLDITPQSSRFSYNTGLLTGQNFYRSNGPSSAWATNFNPWFEADYQINDRISAFASIWPEVLINRASVNNNDSNEVDIGANIEIIKGWTASPYLSIEPVGLDTSSAGTVAKGMQLNLNVVGTIL
jgi:hypothetical protein